MIEDLVDFYSGIVQLLIVAVVLGGAYLGYSEIPTDWPPLFKVAAGGAGSFAVSAIVMGPFLVLLDIRNIVRSIERKKSSA